MRFIGKNKENFIQMIFNEMSLSLKKKMVTNLDSLNDNLKGN